jgi:hypothetical protein
MTRQEIRAKIKPGRKEWGGWSVRVVKINTTLHMWFPYLKEAVKEAIREVSIERSRYEHAIRIGRGRGV